MAFDLLHLNGEDLRQERLTLAQPQRDRFWREVERLRARDAVLVIQSKTARCGQS